MHVVLPVNMCDILCYFSGARVIQDLAHIPELLLCEKKMNCRRPLYASLYLYVTATESCSALWATISDTL